MSNNDPRDGPSRADQSGAQASKEKPSLSRSFQPPPLHGDDLRRWATATAMVATHRTLAGDKGGETATSLARHVLAATSEAMNRSAEISERECQAGCPFCCYAKVAVTPPEALLVAHHIREEMSSEDAASIGDQLRQVAEQTRGMTKGERFRAAIPCALLSEDGQCRVYPARPVRCRGWYSLSKTACEALPDRSKADEKIPLDADAFTIGQGVAMGLSEGAQAAGLDGGFYELHSAVAVALADPQSERRWLNNDPVFTDCEPMD